MFVPYACSINNYVSHFQNNSQNDSLEDYIKYYPRNDHYYLPVQNPNISEEYDLEENDSEEQDPDECESEEHDSEELDSDEVSTEEHETDEWDSDENGIEEHESREAKKRRKTYDIFSDEGESVGSKKRKRYSSPVKSSKCSAFETEVNRLIDMVKISPLFKKNISEKTSDESVENVGLSNNEKTFLNNVEMTEKEKIVSLQRLIKNNCMIAQEDTEKYRTFKKVLINPDSSTEPELREGFNEKVKFTCSICQAQFILHDNFIQHQVTHQKKTITCSDCRKTFTRTDNLKRHMRTHE